jgi:hypothetical protein
VSFLRWIRRKRIEENIGMYSLGMLNDPMAMIALAAFGVWALKKVADYFIDKE